MGAKERFPIADSVVSNDDGFPSAKRQLRQRILIGHATGQPERVGQSFIVRAVIPEARPAHSRAKPGAVDGDDSPVAGRLVTPENDPFVTRYALFNNVHRNLSHLSHQTVYGHAWVLLLSGRLIASSGSLP